MKKYFIATIILLSLSGLFTNHARAFSLGLNSLSSPFGGKVLTMIPCTCTPGLFLITVGTPRGGTFIYSAYSSRPYQYFFPSIGRWVLGTASTDMTCMVGFGPYCISAGSGKMITMFGTSL